MPSAHFPYCSFLHLFILSFHCWKLSRAFLASARASATSSRAFLASAWASLLRRACLIRLVNSLSNNTRILHGIGGRI